MTKEKLWQVIQNEPSVIIISVGDIISAEINEAPKFAFGTVTPLNINIFPDNYYLKEKNKPV